MCTYESVNTAVLPFSGLKLRVRCASFTLALKRWPWKRRIRRQFPVAFEPHAEVGGHRITAGRIDSLRWTFATTAEDDAVLPESQVVTEQLSL